MIALLSSLLAHAATLDVSGTCPGDVTWTVTAAPSAPIALLFADGVGVDPMAGGPCAGGATGLDDPQLGAVLRADAAGLAVTTVSTTAADCDALVQAVDLRRCRLSPARRRGPAPDYAARGPWEVGSTVLQVTGRTGVSLPSELWFPSEHPGSSARIYQTQGYPDGLGTAWTDVTPTCLAPRPVLVHSHGNSSLPFEMFEVMEQLASHGWIVLAPEHTGNSWHAGGGNPLDIPFRRPRDVADAFDALVDAAQRPGSPLAGCVDPAAGYVVSGNSFGGYTAYATGGALVNDPWSPTIDLSDPRVRAIVAYVPWDVLGLLSSGVSAVDVPVLTFGGVRDQTVGTTYMDLFADLRTRPRVGYSFPNGGHFSFTPLWCTQPGDGCGRGWVDLDLAVQTAWTGTLAFLEHLRGRDGAIEQLPSRGPFDTVAIGTP